MSDRGPGTRLASRRETTWRVRTLPRTDGVEYTLTLSTPTDDQATIAAIEQSAAACGMVIERLADDAE